MHVIPELNRTQLREFGLVTGAIFVGLFGLALPWLFAFGYPAWPWWIAVVLGVWALAAPQTLRPVYRVWMRLGMLLGRITTPIVLGILFFLVIAPMGYIMRLAGHDPMARQLDKKMESYRVLYKKAPKKNMEKPF